MCKVNVKCTCVHSYYYPHQTITKEFFFQTLTVAEGGPKLHMGSAANWSFAVPPVEASPPNTPLRRVALSTLDMSTVGSLPLPQPVGWGSTR